MIEQHHTPQQLLNPQIEADGEFVPAEACCPACGRNDKTAKASVIARSGRGRLMLDEGSSAYFETELAALLGEPAEPRIPTAGRVLFTSVAGWAVLAAGLGIVAGLRMQESVSLPAVSLQVGTWLGVGWFGLLVPLLALSKHVCRREYFAGMKARWRKAKQRWAELRYCSRDDVVFIEGEGYGVSPEHSSLVLLANGAAPPQDRQAQAAHRVQ